MKRNKHKNLNVKIVVVCTSIFVLVCIGMLVSRAFCSKEIEITPYCMSVSDEEYDFFQTLAKKELPPDASQEQLSVKTQELIYRTVAEYSLGQRMGLCSSYSFASLNLQMEQENRQRKARKANGQVVYGLLEYDLPTYYSDCTNKLQLKIIDNLTENADKALMQRVKAFYDEHISEYEQTLSFSYSLTENSETRTETLAWEDMRLLERQDEDLFLFLYDGEEGDTFSYTYLDTPREVQILKIERAEANFDLDKAGVTERYITEVYYEELLQQEMRHYKLQFP